MVSFWGKKKKKPEETFSYKIRTLSWTDIKTFLPRWSLVPFFNELFGLIENLSNNCLILNENEKEGLNLTPFSENRPCKYLVLRSKRPIYPKPLTSHLLGDP